MIIKTRVSDIEALSFYKNKVKYIGGSQSWFSTYTMQSGGCGPVAAANLIVYTAKKHASAAALFSETVNPASVLKLMRKMYAYIKPWHVYMAKEKKDAVRLNNKEIPPSLGVPSVGRMVRGMRQYSAAYGIGLTIIKLTRRRDYSQVLDFFRCGLEQNSPIALLNLLHPVKMTYWPPGKVHCCTAAFRMHWVVVTGLVEDTVNQTASLEVLTWGGRARVDLHELCRKSVVTRLLPVKAYYVSAAINQNKEKRV